MGVPPVLVNTGKCPLGSELGEPEEGGQGPVPGGGVPSTQFSLQVQGRGRGRGRRPGPGRPSGISGLSRSGRPNSEPAVGPAEGQPLCSGNRHRNGGTYEVEQGAS